MGNVQEMWEIEAMAKERERALSELRGNGEACGGQPLGRRGLLFR